MPPTFADDGVGHLLDRAELVERAHQEALRALLEAAAREIDVFLAQPARDGVDRQVELRELLLVHEDLDLVLVAAAHLDGRRAVDRLEVRLQAVVGKAAQGLQALDAAGLAGIRLGELVGVHERVAHDRFGRGIEAQQDRAARLERQLQQVDLLAHVDAREVHVRAPGELEDHVGLAGARHGPHGADIADDADGLLDRPRDERLEFQRSGARQVRAHRQRRVGEVGQQVQLQARQRHEAEQDDRDRHHQDRDAAPRGELDDLHRALAAVSRPRPQESWRPPGATTN